MKKVLLSILLLIVLIGSIAGAQSHTFPATDTSNTWTGANDFTNVPLIKLRVAAALTTSVNGDCGFDSLNNNWHCYNGADAVIPLIPTSSIPTSGQFGTFALSAGKLTLGGTTFTAHTATNPVFCSPASGSGTAYLCTTSPQFTPGDGDLLDLDFDVGNTGPATLNANGEGAITIQKWFGCSGTPPCNLASGDFKANQPVWIYRDIGLGVWSLMSPPSQFTLAALSAGVAPSGTFDFSGVTLFKGRVGAGATTTVNGDFAYDSTSGNWHFWDNGVDSLNAVVPASTTVTNGDFVTWVKSGSNVVLGDGGVPVTLTGTQTFTNKTLTSPVVNGTPTGTGIPTFTLKKGTGSANYSTSSTSYVQVDGTNLALTVIIPTGWKLAVFATAGIFQSTAVSAIRLALTDGGTLLQEYESVPSAVNAQSSVALSYIVNGDGNSHTIDLRFRTANAADAANIDNNGSTLIPTMTFILSPSN